VSPPTELLQPARSTGLLDPGAVALALRAAAQTDATPRYVLVMRHLSLVILYGLLPRPSPYTHPAWYPVWYMY
jgi:hypothetical protein